MLPILMACSGDGYDSLEDGALLAAFTHGRLSKDAFRHRDHVRLAFIYLSRHSDLAEAALRFRRAFRRFVVQQGVPQLYNETLTWAYLLLVQQRMAQGPASCSLDFLLLHPDLARHRGGLIARYYDLDAVTGSPLAKALFLLPELPGNR